MFVGLRGWTPPKDRLVLFRVIEAQEAHSPATLDEVKARVEKDLRIAAAMQSLEPKVKDLYAAAKRVGLKEAWPLFSDLKKKMDNKDVQAPPAFARYVRIADETKLRKAVLAGESVLVPPNVADIGASREFVDACFEMTADNWTGPDVQTSGSEPYNLATTRPAALPPPAVRMVSLPKLGKWCVVQKLKVDRVDSAKYERELRPEGYGRLIGERGAYLLAAWFKSHNIEKRCGFERIQTGPRAPRAREGVEEEPHPMLDFQ
jgi:hypothetical protein